MESMRETTTTGNDGILEEYAKARKISLNSGSFGNAQMGGKQGLPPFVTLRDKCDRVGHLKKLCGRGLLSAGTWKDRTCVLYENQLFLYEKQEAELGESCSTGLVLNLGVLNTVHEAPTRVTRKAANVFCIGGADKGFFDSTSNRHYFAAKSLSEMKEWVSVIASCVESERRKLTTTEPNNTPTTTSSLGNHYSHKDLPEETKMATVTLPLDCAVVKGRPKGPPGRRLPRSKKSMDTLLDENVADSPSFPIRDTRGRATSLSALEYSNDATVDLRPEPRRRSRDKTGWKSHQEFNSPRPKVDLVYHYTSSEDEDEDRMGCRHGNNTLRRYRNQDVKGGACGQVTRPRANTGTPSSFKLIRKNGHLRGGTPVRYSASMTPPPCVLRKLRQDKTPELRKLVKSEANWTLSQIVKPSLSSTSSLSTLTDEPVGCHSNGKMAVEQSDYSQQLSNTYSSLQRRHKRDSVVFQSPQVFRKGPSPAIEKHLCVWDHTTESLGNARHDALSVQSLSNLQTSIEMLKDKVDQMTTQLSTSAKQISASIEEVNCLKSEAAEICEMAKGAKFDLDKITEEAEGLVEFLRKIVTCQSQSLGGCACVKPTTIGMAAQFNTLPSRKSLRALECISESSIRKKPHRGRRVKSASSSDFTSSDNEAKSVVSKKQYHKT